MCAWVPCCQSLVSFNIVCVCGGVLAFYLFVCVHKCAISTYGSQRTAFEGSVFFVPQNSRNWNSGREVWWPGAFVC